MPTKIETDLTEDQLMEFFRRCAQTPRGKTGPAIQALAEEFGVTISHESANNFRKGALQDYLEQIRNGKEHTEAVVAIVKSGVGLPDAAAAVLGQQLLDKSLLLAGGNIDLETADVMTKAVQRLRSGDQRARYLEVKVRDITERMQLLQFDAVQAAVKHAKEIRAVLADKKLDDGAKTERVRKILFGERPADWKPITTTGAQVE